MALQCSSNKTANYTLISQYDVDDFDEEGDPKNLCLGPRANTELVLIGHYNSKKKADFVVVTNVSNLCSFGDKAAGRFLTESGVSKSK